MLKIFLSVAITLLSSAIHANPLELQHKAALVDADGAIRIAKTPFDMSTALQEKAVALDSLNQNESALAFINQALEIMPDNFHLPPTKAKVLFSNKRFDEAISYLKPKIDKHMEEAKDKNGEIERYKVMVFREWFLAMTYNFAALKKYDEAIYYLSFFMDLSDPQSGKYQSAWYRSLRVLGGKENKHLELVGTAIKRSHYDDVLDMFKSKLSPDDLITKVSSSELKSITKQDAVAEALFFAAIYEQEINKQKLRLQQLNNLAPFGSAEWTMAQILFQ